MSSRAITAKCVKCAVNCAPVRALPDTAADRAIAIRGVAEGAAAAVISAKCAKTFKGETAIAAVDADIPTKHPFAVAETVTMTAETAEATDATEIVIAAEAQTVAMRVLEERALSVGRRAILRGTARTGIPSTEAETKDEAMAGGRTVGAGAKAKATVGVVAAVEAEADTTADRRAEAAQRATAAVRAGAGAEAKAADRRTWRWIPNPTRRKRIPTK